jgi:hypothetical protein
LRFCDDAKRGPIGAGLSSTLTFLEWRCSTDCKPRSFQSLTE